MLIHQLNWCGLLNSILVFQPECQHNEPFLFQSMPVDNKNINIFMLIIDSTVYILKMVSWQTHEEIQRIKLVPHDPFNFPFKFPSLVGTGASTIEQFNVPMISNKSPIFISMLNIHFRNGFVKLLTHHTLQLARTGFPTDAISNSEPFLRSFLIL